MTLPVGTLLYVPPWLAYGRSAELDTAEGWRSFGNNLGRFVYKNYVAGALFLVLVLVATPALVAALRRWGQDPMPVGVLGFAEPGPVLRAAVEVQPPAAGAAHAAAVAGRQHAQPPPLPVARDRGDRGQRPGHVPPLAPDAPAVAETGRWDPALTAGLLLNDIRCRADAMHDDPPPLNREAWPARSEPMRGAAEDPIERAGDR